MKGEGARLNLTCACVLAVAFFFVPLPAAAQLVIDDFTTVQGPNTDPPGGPPPSSSFVPGGMLGAERDLEVSRAGGPGTVTADVNTTAMNRLFFSAPTMPGATAGSTRLTWDGIDMNALTLAPAGLGSVDLTATNQGALKLTVESTTAAGVQVLLEVYTDATHVSRAARVLPAIGATTQVLFDFSEFVQSPGATGPANFAAVGAITLLVLGNGVDLEASQFETAPPVISSGKSDSLANDVDMDGLFDPGDTIRYSVTISNTGAGAEGVDLADTLDTNTTLQGPFRSTPVALNDHYSGFGNVQFMGDGSPGKPSLVANDVDLDLNPLLAVAAMGLATVQGGTVDINADGTFTYSPPPGFRGVDSFPYQLQVPTGDPTTDANGAALPAPTAIATVALDRGVWFVDNTHGGPFQGTQANPFNTVAAAETASGPGDIIRVRRGDGSDTGHNAGLILKAGQHVVGGGAPLMIDGQLIEAGGLPSLHSHTTDHVLTLSSDNALEGMIINLGAGFRGIAGTDSSNATIDNVTINPSGTAGGLLLTNHSGGFTFKNSSITAVSPASGVAVTINSGSGAFDFSTGSSIAHNGGGLIHVSNTTGGATFDFSGTNPTLTNGGTHGIQLSSNAGGAGFTFTGIGAITTASGHGIQITSSGTVNMTTVGALAATGGAGLDISNTTIGGSPTFTSVSSTNSSAQGINLVNVMGALTISGGAISGNAASSTAFNVSGGSDTISYAGTIAKTNAGRIVGVQTRGGGTTTVSGNLNCTSGCTGVFVNGNTGGSTIFSGGTKTVNTGTNAAVTLTTNTGHTINFTGGGLNIDTTTGIGFVAIGGGTVNVTGAGNTVDVGTGAQHAVDLNGIALGVSDVTFASITAAGATTAQGIDIDAVTNAGTFNGGNVTIPGTGGGAAGIDINGSSGAFNFASATIDATGGAGINLTGANGVVTFTTVDIDAAAGAGVQVTNNSNAVNVNGGTIGGTNDPAGNAVDVDGTGGGTGNVTIAAAVTKNTAGRVVEVTTRSGGTATVSGNLSCTSGCTGIFVNGNTAGSTTFSGGTKTINTATNTALTLSTNTGHTINFTGGGLDIDTTTGTGFNATGGATAVNVTGTANTINSTSATALNVVSTTIGASGMTFQSISSGNNTAAPDPVNGIVLNTTGGGTFEVTGEGPSDPAVVVGVRGRTLNLSGGGVMAGLGSGGLITGTTGDGIVLATASNVTLRNMVIGDATATVGQVASVATSVGDDGLQVGDSSAVTLDNLLISAAATHGLRGTNVTGLTIVNTEILNAGTAIDEDAVNLTELLGVSSIANSVFDGMHSQAIMVLNNTKTSAMTTDDLTITNSRVSNSDATAGEIGIQFTSAGSSNFNLVVHDSLIRTIEGTGIGVFSGGANPANPSDAHVEVQRTGIIGAGLPDFKVPTAVQVNPSFEGNSTFLIANNNLANGGGFTGIPTAGIIIKNDSNGLLRGTIDNNYVRSAGEGLFLVADGAIGMTSVTGTVQVTITNNNFAASNAQGMLLSAQDGAVALEAKLGANTVVANGAFFGSGINLDVQSGTGCFNLATATGAGNNVATGPAGGGEGIGVFRTGGTLNLEGFGGGNDAAAQTFIDANNTSTPGAFVFSGANGTSACAGTP